jgi:predicted nucleic acid-binding protein/Arc/MetJ family transcription regulator
VGHPLFILCRQSKGWATRLDDDLIRAAQEFTGVDEKTALVREALKALIERESARRLASLGGTMPGLKNISRRRGRRKWFLADTSVWIDHFRYGDKEMRERLNRDEIAIHPFVVTELALGSLKGRAGTLALLDQLPQMSAAQVAEVRLAIEARHLYGLGIGFVDAHLIASVFISSPTLLWTRDKRLRRVAERLGIDAGLA